MDLYTPTGFLAVVEKDLDLIARLRALGEPLGKALLVARSADEAILYLRGVGVYSDRERYPFPETVLLDTFNEDASDLAVLSWIRSNSELTEMPVGLLTKDTVHELHVLCAVDRSCFLVSRTDLTELSRMIAQSRAMEYAS